MKARYKPTGPGWEITEFFSIIYVLVFSIWSIIINKKCPYIY